SSELPGGVVGDLNLWLLQKSRRPGLLPQILVVVLARLLDPCLFQQSLKLRLNVIKGFPYLLFLHYVKSLQFGVGGFRNFTIYFLLKTFFGGNPPFHVS